MKLQQKVSQYRQEAGITLRTMGGLVGITNCTLSRIEHGYACDVETLIKLAKFFHTTTDDLLGVTHDPDELNNALDRMYWSLESSKSLITSLQDNLADIQRAIALTDEQLGQVLAEK